METQELSDLVRSALWLVVWLSAAPIGIAFVTAGVIGLIQTATQLQEQTIAMAPKLIGVYVTMILAGGGLALVLVERSREWWGLISEIGLGS